MDHFLDSWHSYLFRYCSVNNSGLSYESQGNKHTVDFTQNSTVKFEFNSTPEADKYTLKQLNTMGNETFHEVVQMLDSCMKQNMNMSIIDLGFENY